MMEKAIERIAKEDIKALIANHVPEGRDIEYKAKQPGSMDSEKNEFLHDVSSFANAAGGDLIYGVEARDGVPESAPGLAGITADAEKLRLESLMQDLLDPRIPGVQIKSLDGFAQGPVLIVRVPRSWRSPHMVKKSRCFYSRNSAGKYLMDTTELRSAFEMSGGVSERIRQFRDERLGRIVAGETPVRLMEEAKVVLHVVPLSTMGSRAAGLDLAGKSDQLVKVFQPIHWGGGDPRYNLDGFVVSNGSAKDGSGCFGYCQLFRNGAVESVFARITFPGNSGEKGIAVVDIERDLIRAMKSYLGGLRDLNVAAPFEVMVSMLGVKGAIIADGDSWHMYRRTPIDRDVALLPDVLVEEHGVDVPMVLRPVFDAMWNAGGYERSMSYDDTGQWNPKRR